MTLGTYLSLLLFPSMFQQTRHDFSYLVKSLLFIPFDIGSGAIQPLVRIGWTINCEMLFYLLFFIAFHISMKYRGLICSAFLAILVGMVQIFAPAISSWQSPIGNVLSPFLIFTEILSCWNFSSEILAYYLLRYLYRRHTLHPVSRTVSLVSAVCIPVIFCLLALLYAPDQCDWVPQASPVGAPGSAIVNPCLSRRPAAFHAPLFVQLGNISYSLYLVHYYPVMFLDRVVFDFSTLSVLSVVGLIVSVVISIVLAYLCWILIERKFTGWLRRILLR